jgi:hypothetical protein
MKIPFSRLVPNEIHGEPTAHSASEKGPAQKRSLLDSPRPVFCLDFICNVQKKRRQIEKSPIDKKNL